MSITDILESKEAFCSLKGIDYDKVREAENVLGVIISEDYFECIMKYGIFSYAGHEFTGICDSKRLNIISVTKEYRKLYGGFDNMYVIEVANIDGVVIWQNSDGSVYKSVEGSEPIKICDSFIEYVSL